MSVSGPFESADVQVAEDTFIGANVRFHGIVRVARGCVIGDNVIIGANSTVAKDIPTNTVAAGNPTRIISSLAAYVAKNQAQMKIRPCYGEEYTTRGDIDTEKKRTMNCELETGIGFVV